MATTNVAGAVPGLIPDTDRPIVESVAYSKVTWRLLPFLFACYVFAYLSGRQSGSASRRSECSRRPSRRRLERRSTTR